MATVSSFPITTIAAQVVRGDIEQEFTTDQQAQARENIAAVGYDSQTLTPEEKEQARENIGASARVSINVKDYGATGDGVVDEISFFNNARDALASTGGRIIIPAGVYKLGSTWEIGASGAFIEIEIQGGAQINPNAALTSLIKIVSPGVRITGKGVIANSSSLATNGIEVDLSTGEGIQTIIENQYITSFTNGILWSAGHAPLIMNNFMNNANNIVFADEGTSAGIHNNYLIGGNGITISNSTVHMEGPSITGNNILVATGTHALRVNGGLEVYAAGNILDCIYQTSVVADAVVLDGDGHGVSFVHLIGNWIQAGAVSGSAALRADGGAASALGGLDICSNTISRAAGASGIDGIVISNANGGRILGNKLAIAGAETITLVDCVNLKIVLNEGVNLGDGASSTGGINNHWIDNDANPALPGGAETNCSYTADGTTYYQGGDRRVGVLPGNMGGTGNNAMQFTGPATTQKTYTLPNANETIATLGQAQTFTGAKSYNATLTVNVASGYAMDMIGSGGVPIRLPNNLPIAARNSENTLDYNLVRLNDSEQLLLGDNVPNVFIGDGTGAIFNDGNLFPKGTSGTHALGDPTLMWSAMFGGYLGISDGITAPATTLGVSKIYVDSADGDLKIKFGDGTVKTIMTDT